MATYTVTTDSDAAAPGDGLLSLREALALADADPGADTIDFAADLADRVIFLAQGQLTAASDVTIDGDDLDITINAGSASRVLLVEGGGTDMTLDSLTITGGQTTELSDSATGGGIHADAGTSLTLAGTAVIANSTAAGGGGIYAGGELTLTGSTVADNNVTGEETQGAGILANADVSLFQSAVTANFATGAGVQGGGIFAFGDVTLDASTVNGNEANGDGSYGGGIFGTGAVTLTNSTLAANSVSGTTGTGGGIFAGGIVSLTDSTLTSHYAALGGAIAARSVTTANSIVVGNFAASLAPDILGELTTSNGHNLFGSDVRGNVAGDLENIAAPSVFAATLPIARTGVSGGVLAENGGPTETVALLDAATNPALGRGEPNDLDTDQRGEPRPPPGGNPDIGAFELEQAHGTVAGTASGKALLGSRLDETLLGLAAGEQLYGRAGDDLLDGGAGRDRLFGGRGADLLIGGADADRFVFKTAAHSPPGGHDVILDFSRDQGDRINLRPLDAFPGRTGDQKLEWIDTDAFTDRGQVRQAVVAGHTVIEVNLDQDGRAELAIALDREIDLQRSDFLL